MTRERRVKCYAGCGRWTSASAPLRKCPECYAEHDRRERSWAKSYVADLRRYAKEAASEDQRRPARDQANLVAAEWRDGKHQGRIYADGFDPVSFHRWRRQHGAVRAAGRARSAPEHHDQP